jgi:hypothetical protein
VEFPWSARDYGRREPTNRERNLSVESRKGQLGRKPFRINKTSRRQVEFGAQSVNFGLKLSWGSRVRGLCGLRLPSAMGKRDV